MSTFTGQSDLQPLQARQRSSASLTSRSRQPPAMTSPVSISNRRWARPLVVCFSSRVTMKLGHIVPPSVRLHLPIPTQRRVASTKLPPSSGKAKWVRTGTGRKEGPNRRFSSAR